MSQTKKIIRVTTVPISLKVLLRQQLKFMAAHFDIVAVSSPGKTLEEVQTDEGVRVVPVAMTRAITPLKDLKALWQLYRFFRKEQPAIVHSHTPKAGLLSMVASKMAGVPVRMHTVAGLPLMESQGFKKIILEWVERLTYKCATTIYPNSRNLAAFITNRQYCKPGKIKVLGNGSSNGINMDFFQATDPLVATANIISEKLMIKKNDFVFLFIGRLVKDKGLEELVDAFCQLKEKYNDIKLLLVGPFEPELDPLQADVHKKINENDAIIQIDFQQDIRPYLIIGNVLTFPSYREGFPNVPMQAGCFDLPSIVSDINGCNEIIEHGKNGLIIPVKDRSALLQAMELLLTDQSLFLNLKANARTMIRERYEQKQFWNMLLNEYHHQLKLHDDVS